MTTPTQYVYSKQQFVSDVSLNGATTLSGAFTVNNASTQISSSNVVGISGGIVNISGGIVNISGGIVNIGGKTQFNADVSLNGHITTTVDGKRFTSTSNSRFTSAAGYTTFINNDKTSGHLYLNSSSPSSNVIVENGNVGVGTASPGAKLAVDYSGIVAGQTVFSLHTSNTSSDSYNLMDAGHGTGTSFVIKGSGYVGIGTTNPSRRLHINSNDNQLASFTTSSTESCFMDFTNSSSAGRLCVGVNGNNFSGSTFANCGTIGTWSNTALTFATNATERMRINANGNVGIGTTNPGHPLEITSYSPATNTDNGYYFMHNTVERMLLPFTNARDSWSDVSLKVVRGILGSYFAAYSDTRIKKNIVDIDDDNALSILRQIKPKTYYYIDKLKRGDESVIGFIAQEIKEIIPKAVSIVKDYIPNFMTLCEVSSTDSSNIVLVTSPIDLSWNPLHDVSGNAFIDADGNASSDASGNKVFKIKLYDQSNNEIECKTTDILDKRCFLIDITGTKMLDSSGNFILEKDGGYFLYGQEIDDFHTLDKNAIFTVVTAAVQDIDRIVQAQAAQINAQQAQINAQQAQINAILAKIGGV